MNNNVIIINDSLIRNINKVYKKEYSKSDIFCKRYYVYRYLLTRFLINEFSIKSFDIQLEKSNLNYLPVNELDMDFYQYFSKDYLKYFYIRNEIYLNNLSADDITILDKCINELNWNNDLMIDFVKKTYKNVITKNLNSDIKYKVFFGPDSLNYAVNDGEIVIGIRYDEFNLNGYSDEEWNELHDKQINYLNKKIESIEQIFNNEIRIIRYNEYNVL